MKLTHPVAIFRHRSRLLRDAWQTRQPAEVGQAIVWFAMTVTLLIAGVAIVTDTGQIWINRRYLQNAADAAALAGVQQLPNDTASARSIACTYATIKNAVVGMTVACDGADIAIFQSHVANDTIRVKTHKTLSPLIGGLFGWPDVEIGASATALLGSAYSACPFPIFQTPEMLPAGQSNEIGFYSLTALHLAGADNQKGDFLTVDVGNGANAVLDAMVNNTCGTPIGPTAATEPGGKIGKVVDGFQWRVACATGGQTPNNTPACPGASSCPLADVSSYVDGSGNLVNSVDRSNCTRLVIVPIFPGPFSNYNGKTTVTIEGFAVFYIAGVCPPSGNGNSCSHSTLGTLKKGDAYGYFVRMAASGSDVSAYNGYGTKAAVLCDSQC